MLPPPPSATLFPYTTLFRSHPNFGDWEQRRESLPELYDIAGYLDLYSSGRRSEEHTSELQSRGHLVCRLLLEKKKSAADVEFNDASTKAEMLVKSLLYKSCI